MNNIVADADAITSDVHGCPPSERTVEELIEAGIVVIDKPSGPNSHQVSAWARDLLGVEKLGHGGTLDPFATGVLVLLSGKSMRLTKKVLNHKKTYICVLQSDAPFDPEMLESALVRLSGEVYNVPPEVSAVKVQVRTRKIENKLLEVSGKDAVIQVDCEAGTYIRTLARDLGLLLSVPIKLKELRRTQSGRFSEHSTITMQQLADAIWLWKDKGDETAIRRILAPIESLVSDLPSVVVKDGAASAIAHGASLLRPGIVSITADLARGDTVQILTLKGELVGIGSMKVRSDIITEMEEGVIVKPNSVFLSADTYPRAWKKSTE
ncbi:MAG: RNA-guided pseudouridylation complex pseudouridine synthase subunit Cbf5 [Candidatus Thermoplasmatota archaeon]|nr:RNA-guided pseudouridylation complex pseudouridine synthase subunit Cbf5 [Candidatus Thermoplasmatota archaeon]